MERQTRQRTAVLDAIARAGGALTPPEILALAQASVATLNLSTIYRQLGALQDEGRVAKVVLAGQPPRYEAACEAAQVAPHHHHHHFQCRACDLVVALHACPGSLAEMAPSGYVVETHEITLRGLCASCVAGPSKVRGFD